MTPDEQEAWRALIKEELLALQQTINGLKEEVRQLVTQNQKLVEESLKLIDQRKSPSAVRQQRYRDRLKGRNESVTRVTPTVTPLRPNDDKRNESVTRVTNVTAFQEEKGVTALRNGVTQFDLSSDSVQKERSKEKEEYTEKNITLTNSPTASVTPLRNAENEKPLNGQRPETQNFETDRHHRLETGKNGNNDQFNFLAEVQTRQVHENSEENCSGGLQRRPPERHPGGNRPVVDRSRPKDYEELKAYILEKGLKEKDALWLWAKWMGCNFKNGGKPMARWKAVIVQWQIQGDIFPTQKQ